MSKIDVYLDDKQIDNLKLILNQSHIGVHVLFENSLIAKVFQQNFSEDLFFTVENLIKAQEELIKLLKIPSIAEKRKYIGSLSEEDQARLVRAYFYIIENDIKQTQRRPH